MYLVQAKDGKDIELGVFLLSRNIAISGFPAIGTRNSMVYAVPPEALVVLDDRAWEYHRIQEEELDRILTPEGMATFVDVQQHAPERLLYNEPLPPFGSIEYIVSVPPIDIPAVRHVLSEYKLLIPPKELEHRLLNGNTRTDLQKNTLQKDTLVSFAVSPSESETLYGRLVQAGIPPGRIQKREVLK